MHRKLKTPSWWQPVALVGLMIALLWVERVVTLSPRGHQLTQIALVGLMYALLMRWVRRNQAALREEADRDHWEALRRAHEERWPNPPLNPRQQHFREVARRTTTQEKQ